MKSFYSTWRTLLSFASSEANQWVTGTILSSNATNNPVDESSDFSFPSEAQDDSSPPVAGYGPCGEGILFFIW